MDLDIESILGPLFSRLVKLSGGRFGTDLGAILARFWNHFGTMLEGLGVHSPPFWPSWTLRGRFLGV